MRIPIREKNGIIEDLPDYILVLAWNFFDVIKESNKELAENGSEFLSIQDLHT